MAFDLLPMKQRTLAQTLHRLSFAGKKRTALFLKLPIAKRAQVLSHLSHHLQTTLMASLPDERLIPIFDQLDPDEVTDLVQLLPKKRQKHIVQAFNKELKSSVELLTQFDPASAAGLMNLEYIQVDDTEKLVEVAKQFKTHERRTGRAPVIFVMHEGKLKGYLPGHALGFARPSDKVQKFIKPISSIQHNASHKEVVHVFRVHPHNKLAVLGEDKHVIGVIYSDDILRLLKVGETAALYNFAGVHDEESVTDSVRTKVGHRYKWLIINLGTAFLAAFTVGLFNDVVSKYVLLAVYMPVVAGMGGNAATQTLAVIVRGIALKQIDLKTAWPTLRREVMAGILNGLINGILVAVVVLVVNHDARVAFILGLAMIVNLFVAGFFGTIVPLIMQKMGKDPAASATVFITAATDVLGFMTFLGLATLVLK